MNASPTRFLARSLIVVLALVATGCHAIDSVSPDPAQPGAVITIRGSGFGAEQADSQVLYDGEELVVASWSATRIDATLPVSKPNGSYVVQVVVHGDFSNALIHEIYTETFALHAVDGTVAFMSGTECPEGWAELEDAKGRFVVGRTDGIVVGNLVGTPLAQGEDRNHTHGYSTTVNANGAGIIGVTGCCNSSLGAKGVYDVAGTTDGGDPGMPRIQQLACERVVTEPPAEVDDHPFPPDSVVFFNRQSCPDGFSLYGRADGRFVVATPAGGDVGAQVGLNLENREDRPHDHKFDGSITIPQSSIAALGGLNFDHTAKGVKSFAATARTDEASSEMPYIQLLACKADFRLPPPVGQPVSGDVLPSGTFAYVDDLVCPEGWTRSGAHEGRYLLGLPELGVPYETRGGGPLLNRENREHTHTFSGSVTIPSLDVALVSGCCFDDTGAHGTFGYSGETDAGGVDLRYVELPGCEKD